MKYYYKQIDSHKRFRKALKHAHVIANIYNILILFGVMLAWFIKFNY